MREGVGLPGRGDNGAVGQFVGAAGQSMEPLAAPIEPLRVEDRIDFRGQRQLPRSVPGPRGTKGFRSRAPAEEARPVPGRERHRLVEEEQLRPAAACHHVAPSALEFAKTYEPGLASPAPLQQRAGRGIVNDPAIAAEHAPLRYRQDVAEWRYPVLQRHLDCVSILSARHGLSAGMSHRRNHLLCGWCKGCARKWATPIAVG